MNRMPCKCSGFRVDKCMCKVLRTGYSSSKSGSLVLLTHSNSLCRLLDLKDNAKPNIFVRLIENVYEKCAGYNLRYCPIRGFLRRENHFSSTLKDLIILICFLIANFVVFLTILTKMMVHMYFIVTVTVQWIRRSLSKLDTNDEVMTICPTMHHDYSPPISHKFL